ncbi:MAG: hypothetical protein GKR93_11055 [Gammaproteobacteria bacterium]|nr:hypothetical protein [Gammaproteobacteria bacterium]
MSDIVLYDAVNSPCGRRVRMTLLEKKADFEIRWLALAVMEQKQDWYLKLNPAGLVPTLIHAEQSLFDSNVINEYLARSLAGIELIPDSLSLQTEMRMWMAFEMEWAKPFREAIYQSYGKSRLRETGLDTASLSARVRENTANTAYLNTAKSVLNDPIDEKRLNDCIKVLMERMQWMEEQLSDSRDWLLGKKFTLADITLGPRLDMFPFIGVNDLYQRYPRIGSYMERLKSRPSWESSDIKPPVNENVTFVRTK